MFLFHKATSISGGNVITFTCYYTDVVNSYALLTAYVQVNIKYEYIRGVYIKVTYIHHRHTWDVASTQLQIPMRFTTMP